MLLLTLPVRADEVAVPSVPASAEEYRGLRDGLATRPEGGAACFIAALLAYSRDRKLGRQCLTLILDRGNVANGDIFEGFAPAPAIGWHLDRLDRQNVWSYHGFAYVRGATPQNSYQVSPPFTVVTSRQRNSGSDESGRVKVFVDTAGFRPRPMLLYRNDNGLWKVNECSSFWVNVAPPAAQAPRDDL